MKETFAYYAKHHVVSTFFCSVSLIGLSFGHATTALIFGGWAAGAWVGEIFNPPVEDDEDSG